MPENERDGERVKRLSRAIGSTSNLIGTDFKYVQVIPVHADFVQGESGYLVQFAISAHAVGKLSEDGQNAIHELRKATE